jgi:hypothetical protein
MTDAQRLDFALAFAERATNMGATATTACRLAADVYKVGHEAVLTEWCRRLMAKVMAADAIAKARAE